MTITSLPERELHLLWEDAAPAPDVDRQAPRSRWWLRLWRNEIFLLTLVALAGYVAVAFWIRFGLHFYINDALARTSDAVYVTVGRDPHLAAIGFYWPPLAQLVQLPIVPIAARFGEAIMAGPISSAICMALTIPVLSRIGRLAGLRRLTTFALCAAFAINPVVIYYAGIGMSEACFFLFGAIAMLGFLRYTRSPSTQSIIVFSLGLSGVCLTRLEGPFLSFALIAVAVFNVRRLRRSLWDAVLIAAPPYGMFGLWILAQWILVKDPLAFEHQPGGAAPGSGHAVWLPNTTHDQLVVFPWALHWLLVLGPAVIVVAALVVLRPLSNKTRGNVGIVGGCCVFLAIQMYQVATGTGFGNPRYFVTCILFATVGALWNASAPPRRLSDTAGMGVLTRNSRGLIFGSWNVALVLVLLVAGGVGSRTLTSGRLTKVENECSFFQGGVAKVLPFLGTKQTGTYACDTSANDLQRWQDADAYLDSHVKPTDRILADNASNVPISLFTTKPQLFIVENDRDWQKTIANPRDVTYVVTQSEDRTAKPAISTYAFGNTDEGAVIVNDTPDEWHLIRSYPSPPDRYGRRTWVQIYHFVPAAPGDVPQGTESDISG